MKLIFILILVISCGKNSEPIPQDLRDSDGDHVANVLDDDKFQANVIRIEIIDAQLEFITGEENLTRHKFSVSNNVDLKSYSKNLLINRGSKTPEYDYFSEFSLLKVNSKKNVPVIADYSTKIQLTFKEIKSPPTSLYLVTKEKKIRIGNWATVMDFSLKRDDLKSILAGDSFLSLSHMDDKRHSSGETKGDNIKERTYRVLYDDGKKTEVIYLSKELSLVEVLTKLKIYEYNLIDDQNLLTTRGRDDTPKWWVKLNENEEIIVIKESLNDISNFYIQGLKKTNSLATRINGINFKKYIFNDLLYSRALIRIRTEQIFASFSESMKDERRRVGGRENSDKSGCVEHSRSLRNDYFANQENLNLQSILLINDTPFHENLKNVTMIKSFDSEGVFWEIEFFGLNKFELSLINLPRSVYKPTGLYQLKDCIGTSRDAIYKNNLQTTERSLKLHIETFVENIIE